MNNTRHFELNTEKQDTSAMGRPQAVELTLTNHQFVIIQHFLPKCFTLKESKPAKREKASSSKIIDLDISRISGGYEYTKQAQGRSKRVRVKKIDRYLEQQIPRVTKRVPLQKMQLDDQMKLCAKILNQLKKNPRSIPFLEPVDPKKLGASHYFDFIKDPMDFATVQKNLKTGQYHSSTQFHADISKIWYNSYAYNEKSSKIYKMTIEMEKYYKKLLTQSSPTVTQNKFKSKFKKSNASVMQSKKDDIEVEQGSELIQAEYHQEMENNQYDV